MLKSKKRTNLIANTMFVIKYSFRYCKMRVISIFIIALFNGFNAVNVALFFKYAIAALEGTAPFYNLLFVVGIYLLIHLVSIVVNNIFVNMKYPYWDTLIQKGVSKELYQKYLTIDFSDMDRPEFYNKYIRALNEADLRSVEVLNTLQYFLSNLLSALGLVSVIAYMNPILVVFAIVPVIISFFINISITKDRYNYEMLLTEPKRKIDYIKRVFYLPQYREEMRSNSYSSLLLNKYRESNIKISDNIKTKMPKIINKSVLGSSLFSLINYGFPAIYLGWQVYENKIGLGDFSTLLIGTANLSSTLFYMTILIPQLTQHALFVDNLKSILDYKSAMEPNENSKIIDAKQSHSIELKNVSFKYPCCKDDILKNISLTIKRGEKIALVGENGAGKSTLVKLLLRLYDPQSGGIYLDGTNYKDINVNSLRDTYSVVFQDFQYFAFSIGENILTREISEREDENEIWEALKTSGLYPKVKKLPLKLNTPLTNELEENGVNLSGGEIQKLAISRAIYKNAGIIIMDEPSSSLDPLSEQEMYLRMFKMCQDKTLVLISHRLYSTKMVDKIYYIENGIILESGNHEDLLKLNGKYAKMYRTQAEQYSEVV